MKSNLRKTKIVGTIGPASQSEEMLTKLVKAGLNVTRINFSHGGYDENGEKIETIKKVRKELNKLDKRDKEIMCLRYGLNGYEEMTQKDVAEKLNISQSYISRIEKKVIKRLKSVIKN